MLPKKRFWRLGLIAVPFGILSLNSNAQLVQNLTIGNAKALALGNAVTADPPGVDSIHYNPAGLSRIKDRELQLKFIAADVRLEGEFSSNEEYDRILAENEETDDAANTTSEIDGVAAYVPGLGITEIPITMAMTGGMAYSIPGSSWSFGTAVYAPIVGGYTRKKDDPGRYYGREAAATRITYFSPTFAYKVNDELSLGAGLGFSYFGIGIAVDFRATNPLLGLVKNISDAACEGEDNGLVLQGVSVNLCGGNLSPFESLLDLEINMETHFSPTFNLGVLWQPTPWFSVGAVYQSESKDLMKGVVDIYLTENLLGFTQGLADSNPVIAEILSSLELTNPYKEIHANGEVEVTLPAHFSLGTSLQVTPSIKLNVDWKWTETSVWDELYIEIDRDIPLLGLLNGLGMSNITKKSLTIPRGYENASNFAFGLEYQYNDQSKLRLGYEPRKSGIPDNKLDFLIPLGDFDLFTLGFSYQYDQRSVYDFALAYGHSQQHIPAGTSTNGNSLHADNIVYNPSAGMDVTSEAEILLFELTYQKRL